MIDWFFVFLSAAAVIVVHILSVVVVMVVEVVGSGVRPPLECEIQHQPMCWLAVVFPFQYLPLAVRCMVKLLSSCVVV